MKNFRKELEARPWYIKVLSYIKYRFISGFDFVRYTLPNGVQNVINWAPVVWGHYDFDRTYLLDVMKFKLELMYNRMDKYSYEVESDKSIRLKRIKLVITLLDRMRSAYYENEFHDYYDSDVEFVPNDSKTFSMKTTHTRDDLQQYLNLYPNQVRRVLTSNSELNASTTDDRYRLSMYVAQANHDRCRKILFTYLERHIEGFWY